MRKRVNLILIFFVLFAFTFVQAGCSKSLTSSAAPSDEEAIKAIKSSIQSSPITALSPIQIVDKTKNEQNNVWSYKVKFTASTFVDHTNRKEFVKETTYNISRSTDKAGKSIWVAVEEK